MGATQIRCCLCSTAEFWASPQNIRIYPS
ncbi:hypothetical protein H6G89_14005 [Oscillatoria sp. FACHB-1407]|nr:hypothetical protein [Oscillatoria sp. FACHB-1407]